ncbi:hypothetical protein F4811DRAFT_179999 [Daldinia bambusicola]|nr:hypothetical protein F4811DRAFT_179999 [Daldinia bambusicola]
MTKSSPGATTASAVGILASSWPPLTLLLLSLALSLFADPAQAKKTTITPAPSGPTAVPIFLPDVPGTRWSEWRGSIISRNDVETVYSVFCAPDRLGCTIADDDVMPFRFTEGPRTLNVANTIAGLITVTQACDLTSTTAATCSGSTWVADALTASLGPLVSNTSAAAYAVATPPASWGVLTLGDAPLTRTRGGRTYTYYTTSSATATATATTATTGGVGSNSIAPTATTAAAAGGETAIGAGAGSTSTPAAGGGSGGGGSGSGRGGKGRPKKSGARRQVVSVDGVWKAGIGLLVSLAILL